MWGLWATLAIITATTSAHARVFDHDDRTSVTPADLPHSALVGKIYTEEGLCTGSLVGPDLVLTNAHCVLTSAGKLTSGSISFVLPDSSHRATHVWWGTSKPEANRSDDWAFIRLSDRPGDRVGYFGVANVSLETAKSKFGQLNLIGYSFTWKIARVAYHSTNCSIRNVAAKRAVVFPWLNYWLHDCDMEGGASGAPLYIETADGPMIIALNSAEMGDGSRLNGLPYHDQFGNGAVRAEKFLSQLHKLRKN